MKFKDNSIIFGEWNEGKELGGNLYIGCKKKNQKGIHEEKTQQEFYTEQ